MHILDQAGSASLTVATWNTRWASSTTKAGPRVAARVHGLNADLIVITEGTHEILPPDGYVVDAGPDWGSPSSPLRRKVIVWSRFPLTDESPPTPGALHGRLVVASATTAVGPVRIMGVCIPWRDAHVVSGRCDARPWSEHLDYLDRLDTLLQVTTGAAPTVMAGDFNQRVPRHRQPIRVASRLATALRGFSIHTAGDHAHGPHVDHVATNGGLVCRAVHDWPACDSEGPLSDHAGVSCTLVMSTPVS